MQRAAGGKVRRPVEARLSRQSYRTFQPSAQIERARHLAERRPHLILKCTREIGDAVDRAGEFDLRLPRGHAAGIDLHAIPSHRQRHTHVQRHRLKTPPMESSGRDGQLPAIPRAGHVVIELHAQIVPLRVEGRLPLTRHFEAAILQAVASNGQIQYRLNGALAGARYFRRRQIGSPIRIENHVNPRTPHIQVLQIDRTLQHGNDLDPEHDGIGASERGSAGRLGPVQYKAVHFGAHSLPIEVECANLGAAAGGPLHFRHDPLADFLAEPIAAQNQSRAERQQQRQRHQASRKDPDAARAAAHRKTSS